MTFLSYRKMSLIFERQIDAKKYDQAELINKGWNAYGALVPSDGENCLKHPASKDFEFFDARAPRSSFREHFSVSSYQAEPVPPTES
jgi:hypothetical protein